jgi:hypothetical protein
MFILSNNIGVVTPADVLLAQAFLCGVKRDTAHYKDFKKVKHF